MEVKYGKRLREIRKEKGLTQVQLAKKTKLGLNTIRRYESDQSQPTIEVLANIMNSLNSSISDFFFPLNYQGYSAWDIDMKQKLKHIGYELVISEDNEEYYIDLKYPDGTLEVTMDELQDINNSTNEYLKFKLLELKKKHIKDFRSY